mmetsp:Transcript_33072/g.67563  ORF Transcript_33072/g.67563 Transcript_33072/m.67563 type:complete len:84 (-) Transcript_33072:183-434(-)
MMHPITTYLMAMPFSPGQFGQSAGPPVAAIDSSFLMSPSWSKILYTSSTPRPSSALGLPTPKCTESGDIETSTIPLSDVCSAI